MTESLTSSIEEVMDSLCDSSHSEELKEVTDCQNTKNYIAKSPLVNYDVSRYGDYDNQIGETSVCRLEKITIPRFNPNLDIPTSSLTALKSAIIMSDKVEEASNYDVCTL